MKKHLLSIVLMTMVLPTIGFGQEAGLEEDIEQQMHLRSMELELEKREAESDFQRKMQELELEQRGMEIERERAVREYPCPHPNWCKPCMRPLLLICFVVHILLAVWVYKDIRQRNAGSGLWIVVALLTGLLGALVYAVVRLGDSRQTK